MKLTIAMTSLAAFTYTGSQFCYAEDLLDTVLNTCISYVHKQIPDSKFGAYIVDRSTGALNKFGTERDSLSLTSANRPYGKPSVRKRWKISKKR